MKLPIVFGLIFVIFIAWLTYSNDHGLLGAWNQLIGSK